MMKWNPNKVGALRAKWRYRPEWMSVLSRRGICLHRCLSHAAAPGGTSRRAAHRLAGI